MSPYARMYSEPDGPPDGWEAEQEEAEIVAMIEAHARPPLFDTYECGACGDIEGDYQGGPCPVCGR